MAKAPDLSPLALSLVDKLLARLPASVSDLETWWGKQGKVTRLELVRLLRRLDGDRLVYDRDAGMVRPMGTRPAATEPSPQVRAAVSTRARRHAGTSTPIISEKMLKASTPVAKTLPPLPTIALPKIALDRLNEAIGSANDATASDILAFNDGRDLVTDAAPAPLPPSVLDAGILTMGRTDRPTDPVSAVVGGVTITGSAAAVKEAARAYQRALLAQPTTPRPPAKRGPQPSAGSVSERVRASVCRKPGTVAEVIARFPDVNENTIRGALGTLKAKGLVGHTSGKYGAPRG